MNTAEQEEEAEAAAASVEVAAKVLLPDKCN